MVQSMAEISIGAWDDAFDHAAAAVERGHVRNGSAGYTQRARLQVLRAAGWLERLDAAEAAFRFYFDDPRMPEALRMMVVPSAWALAAALGGRINDADYWSHIASEAGEQGHHSMLSTEDVLLAQAIVSARTRRR